MRQAVQTTVAHTYTQGLMMLSCMTVLEVDHERIDRWTRANVNIDGLTLLRHNHVTFRYHLFGSCSLENNFLRYDL